jgi:hypothetical protein
MIYFVEACGLDRVKVGSSVDVAARLTKLRVVCPVDLRLLKVIEGGRCEEKCLHRRWQFARVWTNREWFTLSLISDGIRRLRHVADDALPRCRCGKLLSYRTALRLSVARNPSPTGLCRSCLIVERKPTTKVQTTMTCSVGCGVTRVVPAGYTIERAAAWRCRSCAMREAWAAPGYYDARERSRQATRRAQWLARPCAGCGLTGTPKSRGGGRCSRCAGVPSSSFGGVWARAFDKTDRGLSRPKGPDFQSIVPPKMSRKPDRAP